MTRQPRPRCSRHKCTGRPTHLVDTNRPPYAGPQLMCEGHMDAATHDVRPGEWVHISAIGEAS